MAIHLRRSRTLHQYYNWNVQFPDTSTVLRSILKVQQQTANTLSLFAALLILLTVPLFAPKATSQNINQFQITSSYIYNFTKNIEWSNQDDLDNFAIAVYRPENLGVYNELQQLAKVAKIKNLPITVTKVTSIKSINRYQIVYLDSVNDSLIEDIYNDLKGKSTLLITQQYSNKQFVMINLEPTNNNRYLFEVNKANLLNHGLTPLPELILNGGSEIDVAKLFREGQASLVSMQKQLTTRERNLVQLSSTIKKQESINAELKTDLVKLNEKIEKSNQQLARQNSEIQQQSKKLQSVNQERERLQQDLAKYSAELNQQNIELLDRQKQLKDVRDTIANKEAEVSSLNVTLEKQKSEISELDELVSSQKKALTYSWALAILGALFASTLFFGYLMKRKDNERLRARTRELQIATDRLVIAKKVAESANQAKSRFLSLMSHELRTPLQAIIGYTDVVLEEMHIDGEIKYEEDLTRVLTNSERLLKLINSVLDLAKIEAGRMDLDLINVDIKKLIDEAIGNVKPQIEKKNNQLHVEVQGTNQQFSADYEKLLHITLNLLSNAGKFTENGAIWLTASHSESKLLISVRDTGIGLSEDQQAQIFDQFKQADSSTTRKFGGTGLGLAITKQFVELMGGNIELTSKLGEGSTFSINIPLPINPLPEAPTTTSTDAVITSASEDIERENETCVLIIDDDPAFADIVSRTVSAEGYQVYTAGTAADGLELAKKIKPDLITLDILLPDQHGYDLYQEFKKTPELKNIPIIAASIYDKKSQNEAFIVDVYLTKPISRIDLKTAVQKLAPITSQLNAPKR